MADRKPLKVLPDGGGDSTGLGEFVDDDTIAVADGGTGATTASGARTNLGITDTNPGGSNTELQYNNSGAFGASANLTFADGTLKSTGNAALASQDAHKIILVDLTDPSTMWDVEAFLARVRHTSWYEELSAPPPMRGAIWINNAKRDIVWWNLDTDAVYMTFTAAANNVVGGVDTNDLAFLDGKLYFAQSAGTRFGIVDFLRDHIKTYDESQLSLYNGNIKERNDANNFLAYNTAASQRILCVNSIYSVAAVRDPLRFDEFDRPEHWWAVSTDASGGSPSVSVYNPITDTIYYGGNLNSSVTSANKPVALSPNGGLVLAVDLGSQEYVNWFSSVYAFHAAWATGWNEMYLNAGSGANTHPFSSSVDWAALDICDAPPLGGQSNIVAVGGNEGLVLAFAHTGNDSDKTAIIAVTNSYNTPYMKGARAGAYPLNDANDRGGGGNNLTNNGSTLFNVAGPFGNCAIFNGTDQSLTRSGDSDFDMGSGDFVVSLYFKTTSATNPTGTSDSIMMMGGSSNQDILSFQLGGSTGVITVGATSNNWTSHDSIATTADFHDAKWHHAVYQKYNGNWELWADGVLCATTAVSNAGTLNFENLAVGTGVAQWDNTYMAGQVAQLSICKTGWTPHEINLEYQRMVRGLGGATATLANDNVKSVRIDQNSGLAAITTAANQTEIWDITTGLRESIDAANTGDINDADVALKSGADDPEYLTGRVAAIEYDGQARRVIG